MKITGANMANTPSARNRARQNETRRLHNASRRSMMRTHIKSFLKSILAGDKEKAKTEFQSTVSLIDKIATEVANSIGSQQYHPVANEYVNTPVDKQPEENIKQKLKTLHELYEEKLKENSADSRFKNLDV